MDRLFFILLGICAVLTGLLRNIDPSVKGHRFGEAEDWEKLQAAL